MMESTESRFAHLLQPIRDLTKNWEIDVASELNDYLEELDEMCITFDGGQIRLNFAEAALLIQGSTCIYSKKVELLHSLVYQTLEYINDRSKKRNKQAAAETDKDADGSESHDADDMAEFTALEMEVSKNSRTSDCSTTISVIPLPPESLIPPETHEKHKLPLISAKGEIACSQKDFRINLFVPRDDLILLTIQPAASAGQPLHPLHPLHLHLPGSDEFLQQLQEVEVDGGDDAADGFAPLEENPMEVEEHVERQQARGDGRMLRERRQVEADKRRPDAQTPPAVNVWAFHDPYAVTEERPFKSEKCYKVPDGLDDGGKRKRRRAAVQDFRTWFTGTFNPHEQKLKNGPTFTDLNYMYVSTLKDRMRNHRRIYRKTGVAISEEELRRTLLQPEGAGPHREGEEPVEGEHDHLLGGDDEDAEDEGFPDDAAAAAEFPGGNDFASAEPRRDELTYEDLVKLRVEQLVVNSRGYTQETSLTRRVKEWEDEIRPKLDLQEQQPVFDIHEHGRRIVDSLSGVGQRRRFSSIVHDLDNFEACKYLLASLQLANDYTVEIDSAAGLEDSLDSMGLTLLSTLRATDRFKALSTS